MGLIEILLVRATMNDAYLLTVWIYSRAFQLSQISMVSPAFLRRADRTLHHVQSNSLKISDLSAEGKADRKILVSFQR